MWQLAAKLACDQRMNRSSGTHSCSLLPPCRPGLLPPSRTLFLPVAASMATLRLLSCPYGASSSFSCRIKAKARQQRQQNGRTRTQWYEEVVLQLPSSR